jgi:hypothetical protein
VDGASQSKSAQSSEEQPPRVHVRVIEWGNLEFAAIMLFLRLHRRPHFLSEHPSGALSDLDGKDQGQASEMIACAMIRLTRAGGSCGRLLLRCSDEPVHLTSIQTIGVLERNPLQSRIAQ